MLVNTSHNKKMFKMVRDKGRDKNQKYKWTKNGTIYVSRYDKTRVLVIKSEGDLPKIS